ncbi:MAG: peroxiredoxin [Hyphomicrobiaceae bacterium]
MVSDANPDLMSVDWTKIPAPVDDGGARHLLGLRIPDVALPSTDGATVSLASTAGRVVVYAYPRTGQPGVPGLTDDWDAIPGARGCTPQSCGFRDHLADLKRTGAVAVFGLSTQSTEYQQEAATRLHLPFALLSDERLVLADALKLPTMEIAGVRLLKRLAMVIDDGRIAQVFYPVFPPDRSAEDVLAWLTADREACG